MRITFFSLIVLLGGLFVFTAPASGLMISVDLDPVTAGVQGTVIVGVGETITADILVSGVFATSPLNAFEFDADYDALLLGAINIISGGFMLLPSIVIESDITAPDVNFAMATLLPTGADGDGILATITFEALAVGTSLIALNDVVFSAPFGVPILIDQFHNGSVIISNGGSIPVPGTFLLVLSAGLLGACRARMARPI